VLASRIADVPSLVEHGRTGFLFDPGDAKGLRDVLEPLLREPARAGTIGLAAAEEARARFSIEREAEALIAVYRRALEG
jgi:mannosyltransferase